MVRHAILAVIANAMVLWAVSIWFPSYLVISGGILAFLVPGLFLGVLNAIFKPLLKLFALPLIILTAGLFSVVINAFILYVLEFAINVLKIAHVTFDVQGGFFAYVVTGFVLAVMNELAHWLINGR